MVYGAGVPLIPHVRRSGLGALFRKRNSCRSFSRFESSRRPRLIPQPIRSLSFGLPARFPGRSGQSKTSDLISPLLYSLRAVCSYRFPRALPETRTGEFKQWLLWSGICFGLAFITKPSFVLHTALLCAYSATIVVGCHFPWRDDVPLARRVTSTIVPLTVFLLPVICLAIPYYAFDWRRVADYVWSNTRGDNAKFWRLPTGYLGSIWFYMAGNAAKEMMKSHLIIAPCLVTLGFTVAVARKEFNRCWYAVFVLSAAALSLVTFGIARMGNPFFGLTSQLLVSFLAIYFIGSMWDVPGKWLRICLRVTVVLTVLLSLAVALPNPATDRPQRPPVNARQHSINRQVVQAVHSYVREDDLRGAEALNILVAFAGDVNDASMTWIARKEGLPYQFYSVSFSDSISAYAEASKRAAFLIAADADVAGVARWLPSNKIAAQILDWVRTQPAWSLVQAIEASDGLSYFIFVSSENIRPFQNLVRLGSEARGFLAIEGPYPEGIGVVRWGVAPESTTVSRASSDEKWTLELTGRSIPGQTVTILLNGSEQQRHTFKTDGFEDIVVPLAMKKGENELMLRYSTHLPPGADNVKRAVLFRKISLLPNQPGPDHQTADTSRNSERLAVPIPEISLPHTILHPRTDSSRPPLRARATDQGRMQLVP